MTKKKVIKVQKTRLGGYEGEGNGEEGNRSESEDIMNSIADWYTEIFVNTDTGTVQ